MASKKDNKNEPKDDIDRSDSVRHASQDARSEAIEKMKQAQEARKKAEAEEPKKDFENSDKLEEGERHEAAIAVPIEEGDNLDIEPLTDEQTGNRLLKQVKIYSPFKVYFDKQALSVSAVNGTGPFDVLPGHKNFLSLLQPCDVLVRAKAGDEKFKIERGILHVHADYVKIFLDV